ncbi:MAG: hypothetical protein Q8927_00645 [Bacteroidota bacterium]|nr:hypothetical protein [Bacteroidota bacterium]MDP4214674.1 hypothetical protein [Bacteroidota bacterium]MDP4244355.1 hypothetical protein [Bacteroidota bacterium]MDP4254264.1 hypothetical protein [Bacteroidota bacterium]
MHRAISYLVILWAGLWPAVSNAQSDLLILQKKGKEIRTYTIGMPINMRSVYDQWFEGQITDMRHDSVFVNGIGFHYKEIAAIRIGHGNFSNSVLSAGMMVSGAGIFILGAVNGLYRGDKSKDWYTTSGLITGAALLVVGYLLTRTRASVYTIGSRNTLNYLVLGADKKAPARN